MEQISPKTPGRTGWILYLVSRPCLEQNSPETPGRTDWISSLVAPTLPGVKQS